MNIIIYTKDFEPITVLDLPLEILESAERNGVIGIELKPPPGSNLGSRLIKVECFKIRWLDDTIKPILVSDDEIDILMLKPEWLVGQKALVGAYQRSLTILTDKIKKTKSDD
jgi:hypothetical protein